MSRTIRRNKPHLIREVVVTLEEARREEWFYRRRVGEHLTLAEILVRRRAKFLSDAGWSWSVPSWFTNLHVHRPERRFLRREIHRCIRNDNWDDHLPHGGYKRPWY